MQCGSTSFIYVALILKRPDLICIASIHGSNKHFIFIVSKILCMSQFGNDVFEILLEELAAPWLLYEQLEGADIISWAKDIHWLSSQPETLCLVQHILMTL